MPLTKAGKYIEDICNYDVLSYHFKFYCRFDPTREIDENHTVVATARGVFSSVGGVLQSPETGVSIVIPQGAIDEGLEQEIYFKVCRDNTILPPLDRDKGKINYIQL